MLFTLVTLIGGCDLLNDIQEELDGLTNPLVGQGIMIGIDTPDDPTLQQAIAGTDWENGGAIEIFLADATSIDNMAESPVVGAIVKATIGDNAPVRLIEDSDGSYSAFSEDGLIYEEGEEITVSVNLEGGPALFSTILPRAPELDIDMQHSQGEKLMLDLTEYAYENVLAMVINTQTQAIVWSNEPSTPQEIYDFTHSDSFVDRLEIPGTAFANQGVYAVGVAGLVVGDAEQFDNMNTLLSSIMTGKMSLFPVSTIEMP